MPLDMILIDFPPGSSNKGATKAPGNPCCNIFHSYSRKPFFSIWIYGSLKCECVFYNIFPSHTGSGIQNICTIITICGNILEYLQDSTTNNPSQLHSLIRLLKSNSRPDCPQLESLELFRRYQSKLHDTKKHIHLIANQSLAFHSHKLPMATWNANMVTQQMDYQR